MHEALEDLALGTQPLGVLEEVSLGCNLLPFQPLPLLLCYLHPVHLPLSGLIQALQPEQKT